VIGLRLIRLAVAVGVLLVVFLVVTAVADISVAPSARLDARAGTQPSARTIDPRSDVASDLEEFEVLEHEGGLDDARSWLAKRVDGVLLALERARLETRELLPV
jgi:hypothetical protein